MTSQLSDRIEPLVQRALLNIGYDRRAIITGYDFAVPGIQTSAGRVDMAAFSDPIRHDLHTSCIAAQGVTPDVDIAEILVNLSYLATPLALILKPDCAEIWPVTRMPESQPVDRIAYDRLTHYFAEHARDFHPDALTAAKTQGQQLNFFQFDSALFQFAYEATQKILVDKFEAAVGAARQLHSVQAESAPGELTKGVLQILAAAILEDKHLLGQERSSSVDDLIQRSSELYGQYFDVNCLNRIGRDVGQVTFDALRQNVTFRSFTNEMLGYFYENAFVNQDLRRELGVYYTPQSIAKRIMSRLPVEDIPPSDRVVFDGSSGSGNLLLAAFERIGKLLPSNWNRDRRHTYLVQRIHGVDVDQFATQVAGLSLFLIDLPADDAWNVRTADFLQSDLPSFIKPPTIVVGNPPFKEIRSSGGRREQRANLFLTKYLDLLAPGGLMAVILPETFLENSSCRDTRRRLLTECEILELWHLPEGVFPMSNVATVVVIAKKPGGVRNNFGLPVRVERVGALSKEKNQFLNGDHPRFSHVVPSTMPWIEEPEVRFFSSPLERSVWDHIQADRRLRDVAYIRNGIIPGKSQRISHFDNTRRDTEWRPWLAGTRDIDPYVLIPKVAKFVRYPGNLQWPRPDLEPAFTTPNSKVLVNSARAPGNPWRLFAAIDDYGYFPSQGFHCVIPKDDSTSLEELVAFLNSPVASAWVDSRNRKRWIGEGPLGDTPFPVFTDDAREMIVSNVRSLMSLKRRELTDSSRRQSNISTIQALSLSNDQLIYDALGLGEHGRDMLNRLYDGYRRPGFEWQKHNEPREEILADPNERKWLVTGQVIELDAEEDTVTIWVRGYSEGEPFQIPIPKTMPGWALRPEAVFEAEIPWHVRGSDQLQAVDFTSFRPLDFSYSRPEELLDLLGDPSKMDDLYGL